MKDFDLSELGRVGKRCSACGYVSDKCFCGGVHATVVVPRTECARCKHIAELMVPQKTPHGAVPWGPFDPSPKSAA